MSDYRQLNVKIDNKTHRLAKLVAKANGMDLNEFITALISSAIRKGVEFEREEANAGHRSSKRIEYQFEEFWCDGDDAERVYKLNKKRPDLLTGAEENRANFVLRTLRLLKKDETLSNFIEIYSQL